MQKFDLIEPQTLQDACVALAIDEDAKVIAGGTALLTLIKQRLLVLKLLVNQLRDAAEIDLVLTRRALAALANGTEINA